MFRNAILIVGTGHTSRHMVTASSNSSITSLAHHVTFLLHYFFIPAEDHRDARFASSTNSVRFFFCYILHTVLLFEINGVVK